MAVSYRDAVFGPTDLNKSIQERGLVMPGLTQVGVERS